MNERIQQLAEQATTIVNAVPNESMAYSYFDTEKFANLIVLACYEHCKGEMLDKEVADTHELTYNDAVMDCAVGLLQHFGVEL